jgi:hypothetical protein
MLEPLDPGLQTVTGAGAAPSNALISSGRPRRWLLVACTILVLGLAASLAGALIWRSSARADDKQTF